MNPVTAYIDALSKYFDYHGTVSRREYWMFMIAAFIVQLTIFMVLLMVHFVYSSWNDLDFAGALYGGENSEQVGIYLIFLFGVFLIANFLAVTLPGLSLMARRLNDMGWSRWWLVLVIVFMTPFSRLMYFIPGMSLIISGLWYIPIILFGCIPSRND